MDYHYVYMIAQTIKDIGLFACLNSPSAVYHPVNIWVFTHNAEFLNILIQHFGVTKAFRLKPGEIVDLNKQMIYLAYHAHLRDIIDIAQKRKLPSHTTGNSIRHVVETLARFEYPVRNAVTRFFEANKQLCKNTYLDYLCNDSSHGGMKPLIDDIVLIDACIIVESLVKARYEGQLKICESI